MNQRTAIAALLGGVVAVALVVALSTDSSPGEADLPTTTSSAPSVTNPSTTEPTSTTAVSNNAVSNNAVSNNAVQNNAVSPTKPWVSTWDGLILTELEHAADPVLLTNGEWAVITPFRRANDDAIRWYAVTLDPEAGTVHPLPEVPFTDRATSGAAVGGIDGDVFAAQSTEALTRLARLDGETLAWEDYGSVPVGGPVSMTMLENGALAIAGPSEIGIVRSADSSIVHSWSGREAAPNIASLGNDAYVLDSSGDLIAVAADGQPRVVEGAPLGEWSAQTRFVRVDEDLVAIGETIRNRDSATILGVAAFNPDGFPSWGNWRPMRDPLPPVDEGTANLDDNEAVWNGVDLWVHVGGLSSSYFRQPEYGQSSVLLLYDQRTREWLLVDRTLGAAPVPAGSLDGRVLLEAPGGIYLTPRHWRPPAEVVPLEGLPFGTGDDYPPIGAAAPTPSAELQTCGADDLAISLGTTATSLGEAHATTPIYMENISPTACGLSRDLQWAASAKRFRGNGADESYGYPIGRVDPEGALFVEPDLQPGQVVAYLVTSNPFDRSRHEVLFGMSVEFPDGSAVRIDTPNDDDDEMFNALRWHGPVPLTPDEFARPCAAVDLTAELGLTDGVMGKQITEILVSNVSTTVCELRATAMFATVETTAFGEINTVRTERPLVRSVPTTGLSSQAVPYANSILLPGSHVSFVMGGTASGIVIEGPDIATRRLRLEVNDSMGDLSVEFPAESHAGDSGAWWGPVGPVFNAE